jgi:hypothetical protein
LAAKTATATTGWWQLPTPERKGRRRAAAVRPGDEPTHAHPEKLGVFQQGDDKEVEPMVDHWVVDLAKWP